MGCCHSRDGGGVCRRKKKCKKAEKSDGLQDGSAKLPMEKLPESQTMKVMHDLMVATRCERVPLLQMHQGEFYQLLLQIIQKERDDAAAQENAVAEKQHQQLEEVQRVHAEEVKCLLDAHHISEVALKNHVEELMEQLRFFNEVQRRVEGCTLKRDLQGNIQAHGSPGEFWEQELDSLLFVVEMKCERLQEQAGKLLQMQDLTEKNLYLEDQVAGVLQQNEDLKVRMDGHQASIQQLRQEQINLQMSLEKQNLLNQKLKQEKEELLYKLLHRDGCPALCQQAERVQC